MNRKAREEKEKEYEHDNNKALSACCGYFYIKNRKQKEVCKNCEKCNKYKRFKEGSDKSSDVKFHYIDTFRECELYKDEISVWSVLRTAIYNVLYTNDLAISCIYEVEPFVKDQDKETRKIFGALMKRVNNYKKKVDELGKKDVYTLSVFQSFMDERAFDKVDELKESIKDALSKMDVPNAGFVALTEVARTITGYSVLSCEKRYKECLQYDKNAIALLSYKLSDMLRVVESLSDWVGRKCKGLNLNKEKRVIEAYRQLDKILTDRYIINDSLEQSEWYIQQGQY